MEGGDRRKKREGRDRIVHGEKEGGEGRGDKRIIILATSNSITFDFVLELTGVEA